jgi:hypothetical protein
MHYPITVSSSDGDTLSLPSLGAPATIRIQNSPSEVYVWTISSPAGILLITYALRLNATFQLKSFSSDCSIPVLVFMQSELKTTFAYTVVLSADDKERFFLSFPSVDVLVTDDMVLFLTSANNRLVHRQFANELKRVVHEGRTARWELQLLTEARS